MFMPNAQAALAACQARPLPEARLYLSDRAQFCQPALCPGAPHAPGVQEASSVYSDSSPRGFTQGLCTSVTTDDH